VKPSLKFASAMSRVLPQSAFARSVGVLAGGTASAQLLLIVAAPVLTRLYSPEDFGLLAVYAGLLGLFSVVASGRYELAIPLPESDRDAAHVVVLSLLLVSATTLASGLVVLAAGRAIADALGVPRLADYFWLLPLGVLAAGIYQVFNYWAIRTRRFQDIARTRIWQAAATLAIQLLGFKAGGFALLLGQTGGQGTGSLRLARPALAQPEFRQLNWRDVCRFAGRYRQFPIFSTLSGLFNTAGRQLPPIMFAAFFGVGAAGVYALAHRVLTTPMSILGQAIANVLFSSAAEARREDRLGPLVAKVHDDLAQIAMPPTVVLIALGPELFAFMFGAQWRNSGEFARWMAPWLYLVFVTSPLSTLVFVLEKQRGGLVFDAILLLARAASIGIGAWKSDFLLAVMLFAITSAICWFCFLLWIMNQSGNKLKPVMIGVTRALLFAILCIAPLIPVSLMPSRPDVAMAGLMTTGLLLSVRYWFLVRKGY